jgi:hypothetical protein
MPGHRRRIKKLPVSTLYTLHPNNYPGSSNTTPASAPGPASPFSAASDSRIRFTFTCGEHRQTEQKGG